MKTKKEIINELENLKKYTADGFGMAAASMQQQQFQLSLLMGATHQERSLYHLKLLIEKIIKTHPEIISNEDYAEAGEEATNEWKKQIEYLRRETPQ